MKITVSSNPNVNSNNDNNRNCAKFTISYVYFSFQLHKNPISR